MWRPNFGYCHELVHYLRCNCFSIEANCGGIIGAIGRCVMTPDEAAREQRQKSTDSKVVPKSTIENHVKNLVSPARPIRTDRGSPVPRS